MYKSILGTFLCLMSYCANASVIINLNGINYEWLELTETKNMTRDQVEASIAAANPEDLFYGYQYASRQLVEDMLLSFAHYDGIEGYHTDPQVIAGYELLIASFGNLGTKVFSTPSTGLSTDGETISWNEQHYTYTIFGLPGECWDFGYTCLGFNSELFYDGTSVAVAQSDSDGWNVDAFPGLQSTDHVLNNTGSYLVRLAPVPIPSAIWLFGSGLLGLIGVARSRGSA